MTFEWGNADCGISVDIGDAIDILRFLVELSVNQPAGCPPLGSTVSISGTDTTWGDFDCNGSITLGDAIGIARFLVGLSMNHGSGCPDIGQSVQTS